MSGSWVILLAWRVESHRLFGKDVAFCVHHLDQHLVLVARHADEDDGVAQTVTRPLPRQVVDASYRKSIRVSAAYP
jgi:hypothetical protein